MMRTLHFRDAEGGVVRLARAGARATANDRVEQLEEWEARRVAHQLDDRDLVCLWGEHALAATPSAEPPSEAELRQWLDDELAGPAARLVLWRIQRPIRATTVESPRGESPMLSELGSPLAAPTWIACKVVDFDGEPVANVGYELTLADGSVLDGTTDAHGYMRHDGIVDGTCAIRFRPLPDSYGQPARSA